jgi:thioredoxin 1
MAEGVLDKTDAELADAIATGVTLVDFWAPWCGPCQMQAPVLEKVAARMKGQATIVKVNVDENVAAAGEYQVQSIPTLILFKDGAPVSRMVGLQSEDALVTAIGAAQ